MTGAQLNSEFRPYYQVGGNYMYWHDYGVIKLNYLFESLNKIGLVKRFDAQLRLWINTGTVTVAATGPNATNTGYNLTPADNTFSNTCPIMVNYHAGGAGAGIVPDTVTKIVAGLYIARPPTTSFAGINLAASVLAHPLPNCRLYYSQVTVDPQKSIDYVQ
jgi:CubicO group peptidase (beta-lactamase class C family)